MTIDDAIRALNISDDFIPVGASNRPGSSLRATHVTVHNTNNVDAGADARAHSQYVKGPDARARKVSWHYTVDDREVIRHLPDDEIGLHAASGNSKSVAVEICQHAGIDQAAANERAALLCAVLVRRHALNIGSLVTHKFWTGKHCPRLLLDGAGGFQTFVDSVAAKVEALSASVRVATLSVESPAYGDPTDEPRETLPLRVQVLEELLGRALADAELLRRELEATRNDAYETY